MDNSSILEAGALTGRQQAFAMIASKCTYAQAVCLKQIHDTRAYEKLDLTWEQYCSQHAGVGRTAAEAIIKRLDEFGEAYFRLTPPSSTSRPTPSARSPIASPPKPSNSMANRSRSLRITPPNSAPASAGSRTNSAGSTSTNRVPNRITELGIRVDDILQAVTTRARLGRALPRDEAAALRFLVRHTLNKLTELDDMLRPPIDESGR
jgi:hypothetical protein